MMSFDFDFILNQLERFHISAFDHSGNGLVEHLKQTAMILKRWGCSDSLIKAGLCHSVYGTESYIKQPVTLENRQYLKQVLGKPAENLVYLFGAHQKDSLWKNLNRFDHYKVFDRFEYSEVQLDAQELKDLMTLSLANWLEQRPRSNSKYIYLRKKEFLCGKDFLPEIATHEFLEAYSISPKSKDKVLAYIIRNKGGLFEILVFKHVDFPEAGIQVPAGTVDLNKNIENALLREVREESGLHFHKAVRLGSSYWFRDDLNELHRRHIFQLEGTLSIPDQFEHIVKNEEIQSGDDNGMNFQYFWLPVKQAMTELAAEQGAYLENIDFHV